MLQLSQNVLFQRAGQGLSNSRNEG